MARIIKGRQMTARYYKGREVLKEYKQGRLVYEKQTSIPDYLCFTALEAGQFTLTIPAAVTPTYLSYVEWSKDGRTWNHTDNTSEAVTIDVQVAQGDKVYWRGSGNCMTSLNAGEPYSSKFSSTCRFDASGNITSLLLGVNYVTALVNYSTSGVRNVTFANLFRGCTTIVNAKDLILPTFTSYYTYIFYYMFYGCTSLVSSPALVSSELSTACYSGLYRECSNLAQSQVLLAPNLVGFCYRNMFQATKVNNVKCLATDISANECVTNWLLNASSTGTFIQAEGVEWPRGASGIPTGWVDVEKRTMPQGYKQVLGIYGNGDRGANINIGYAVNMKYDKIEVAFKQDEISNGMILQSNQNVNGKCWFYNYKGSSLVAKPFNIYTQDASGVQRLVGTNSIYSPLDAEPHIISLDGDGTTWTIIHNGTSRTSTSYIADLPESCEADTVLFGNTLFGNTLYNGWIYYFKNWNTSRTLIADYVACIRESDSVAGYYDFVSQTFKTAANTSAFTAGQEI